MLTSIDLNEYFKGPFTLEFVGGGSLDVELDGAIFMATGKPMVLKGANEYNYYNWDTITVAKKKEA